MQKSEDASNLNDLASILVYAYLSFVVIFIYCEFGEAVIKHFNKFDDELYQSTAWYLFPIEVQRMLLIFMADSQQPLRIRGYGNIECTRDAFKTVKQIIRFSIDMYEIW